ncbi:hypothetical protein [Catenulispora pinisilvae]|uniref:hypothetical protein n=1 Tax=Catenulispora pinisilvae TaxID=2705253 RepID=UPI0018914D5A|nr:hypothetical protein [Catenulispora pinisilvae]
MMDAEQRAQQRIQSIFAGLGLREGLVQGASDDEIDRFAATQGVTRIPAAVREALRLIGKQPYMLMAGTGFGVRHEFARMRVRAMPGEMSEAESRQTSEAEPGRRIRDAAGMLVLSEHQGYVQEVIDGADLDQPDPPIWVIIEGEVTGRVESVTQWFRHFEVVVERHRQELERRDDLREGRPSWASYVLPRAALTPPSSRPRDRVREIVEAVFAAGLRRGSVAGASQEEIERFAAAQGVPRVPPAVQEVLRLIGTRPGLWMPDDTTVFGVANGAQAKERAVAALHGMDHVMRDLDGILVLAEEPEYRFYVIDGADIQEDDPAVWEVHVHDRPRARKDWGSTTGWLDKKAPNIERERMNIRMLESGGEPAPDWAQDIEPR